MQQLTPGSLQLMTLFLGLNRGTGGSSCIAFHSTDGQGAASHFLGILVMQHCSTL